MPSTLRNTTTREHAATPYPFVVFTFGLIVESIKELKGASLIVRVKVDRNEKKLHEKDTIIPRKIGNELILGKSKI
jgi:hypothetical protein